MHLLMSCVSIFSCIICALFLLSQDTAAQQVICGPALYAVLDGLCMNGYQAMALPKKRNVGLPHHGLVGGEHDNDIDSLPFKLSGSSTISMGSIYGDIANAMAKIRRRRFGIYDECCRKGCTLNELATYCS